MKKIFTLLMLLCTIGIFAANAADTYIGKLSVSVNGKAPEVKDPQSVSVVNGDIVTFTIPKFTIPGSPITADVVITASKDAAGNLMLRTIKYGVLPIGSAVFTNSTLIGNECNINLTISTIDKVEVTFSGKKQ